MAKPPTPTWDRFWPKVDASGDCWEWTAAKMKRGYGVFMHHRDDGTPVYYAHRIAWELLVGPIPGGMTIDHLCYNTSCVNPDHLEVVTMQENLRRTRWRPVAETNKRKTHCPRGHPYEGDNLVLYGKGYRRCKACNPDKYPYAFKPRPVRTECIRGHDITGENGRDTKYRRRDGTIGTCRRCKTCENEKARAYRARLSEGNIVSESK